MPPSEMRKGDRSTASMKVIVVLRIPLWLRGRPSGLPAPSDSAVIEIRRTSGLHAILGSHQLEERFLADVRAVSPDERPEVPVAGVVNPVVDRPQEAPAFGGEPASNLIDQRESQHLLVEVASLRMVDDDVLLPHVGHAMPTLGMLPEALPYEGDLLVGDESGQLLPQEDLGVGVLVDLVALGDRFDESPVLLHREEIPRLACLGPGLVQEEGLALPVHMPDRHENSPVIDFQWSEDDAPCWLDDIS